MPLEVLSANGSARESISAEDTTRIPLVIWHNIVGLSIPHPSSQPWWTSSSVLLCDTCQTRRTSFRSYVAEARVLDSERASYWSTEAQLLASSYWNAVSHPNHGLTRLLKTLKSVRILLAH